MYSTVRTDDVADLADLEGVRRVLERLLHLALCTNACLILRIYEQGMEWRAYWFKEPEVTTLSVRAAVAVLGRELGKLLGRAVDLLRIPPQHLDGLLLRPRNVRLRTIQTSAFVAASHRS